MTSVTSFAVSQWLYGCDCVTGHEHQQRRCGGEPDIGSDEGAVVVPMVRIAVTLEPEAGLEEEPSPAEEAVVEERPLDEAHKRSFLPKDFENPYL